MKKDEIIRAWRDEEYMLSLTDEQRASLPENPVGMVELSGDVLTTVAGGSHYCNQTHVFSECYQTCDSCYSASYRLCCC
jgi:mersacidin/lichenicidin family type 2 lantibiotic